MQLSRGLNTGLRFVEFDRRGSLVAATKAVLPGVTVAHDFLVTDDWYILAGESNVVRASEHGLGSCFIISSCADDSATCFTQATRGR